MEQNSPVAAAVVGKAELDRVDDAILNDVGIFEHEPGDLRFEVV